MAGIRLAGTPAAVMIAEIPPHKALATAFHAFSIVKPPHLQGAKKPRQLVLPGPFNVLGLTLDQPL